MSANLSVYTFGGLRILKAGELLTGIDSRKVEALFIFLALAERPQPREILADLLWDNRSQQQAGANLRRVLSGLRKHFEPHLEITRTTAALKGDHDLWMDTRELQSGIGPLKAENGSLTPKIVSQADDALRLYHGDFLAGFHIRGARNYDAWLSEQREHWRQVVLDSAALLSSYYESVQSYKSGMELTRWTLKVDPLQESFHRRLMRLLTLSGHRSDALQQYEGCRRLLEDELGVPPEPETEALFKAIVNGALSVAHPEPAITPGVGIKAKEPFSELDERPIPTNLPTQITPFVGRKAEIADLNQLLRGPDVRLVTILGAGGMGKTRLALEAGADLLDQFPDGVYFVPLTRLRSEDLIVPSVIQALGIEFAQEDPEAAESRRTLKEHLLNNLRRKNLLLILDGFEHLLEGESLVSEILHTAPDVKVLATSRIRLNISGEQRFPIAGMDVPTGESMRDAQNSDGFRLFLQSARRARPNFKLHPKELKNIAEICHLVEGNPLGIRLAAAWVEVLSPEEIAGEISQSIDLLETDSRDVPAQQRSIRAMFDHSWKLLTLQEREVFQGLSIFRGGFKREAAQKINGATLRDLRSLLNKSMLGQTLDGRYEIHELSREYAAEKLRKSPDGGAAIHKRHSIFYTAATQLWGDDLKSERQAAALEEMDAEIGNIHSAWDWAIDHHKIALLDQSMEGIRHYSVIRRRIQDAETMFRQAAEHLEAVATGDTRRVYARLLCTQGYFTKGDEGKRERYQQSLAVFEVLDAEGQDIRYEKAQVLNYLGSTVKNADFNEALRLLKGSLRLYQNLSNSYWMADVFIQLGYVYIINGNLDEAQKYFERSLKTYQEIGDPRKITQSLQSLPFITIRQGKFEKAERLARQYLAIYEKIGDISAIANGNAVLGVVLWVLGKFQGAHAHLEEASAVHKEIEHFENYLEDTFNLCWTKMEMGCYSQALDTVQSALDWYRGKAGEVTGAHIISGANLISGAYLTGYALSVQGAASLALGRYAEAEGLFQESITAFQETFTVTEGVRPYANLGVLYSILGQPDKGRGYLLRALEMGVEINSKIVHIFALPEVAFLLAEGGDLERATEIYALASRYPWISKSQWFQDVIGGPLATLTASLSSEVIAAAQKRGRERDLDNTVQELMAELA